MQFFKNKDPKRLKTFLLAIILMTLGIIAAVFIGYRHILDKNIGPVSAVDTKSKIAIGKFHHTATRNGIKEWMLDARKVQVINVQNKAVFQDPAVTFYLEDNTKVYLTANQGTLSTDSNDIEIAGNVVVKNENYRLKTENLHYVHRKRILFSKVPVKINSATSQLTADSMSHDLNAARTVFTGNIKGVFSENIML